MPATGPLFATLACVFAIACTEGDSNTDADVGLDAEGRLICTAAETVRAIDEATRRAADRAADVSSPPCVEDSDCVFPWGLGHTCANGSRFGVCPWDPVHVDVEDEVEAIYDEELEPLCERIAAPCMSSHDCVLHPADTPVCSGSRCVRPSP